MMITRFLKRLEQLEAVEGGRVRDLSPLPFIELDYIRNIGRVNYHQVTLEEAERALESITPEQCQRAREAGEYLAIVYYLNGRPGEVAIKGSRRAEDEETDES